jgi:hypothetical protein
MSLPAAWTDRIFEKLTITYGRDFLSRWEGMDLNAVKSDWANELSGLFRHPSSIAWALDHLPEKPPTVVQFRRIANEMPAQAAPRLEYDAAGQERIATEIAKLAPIVTKTRADSRDWARRIVAKAESGGDVTRVVLAMARDALNNREVAEAS